MKPLTVGICAVTVPESGLVLGFSPGTPGAVSHLDTINFDPLTKSSYPEKGSSVDLHDRNKRGYPP